MNEYFVMYRRQKFRKVIFVGRITETEFMQRSFRELPNMSLVYVSGSNEFLVRKLIGGRGHSKSMSRGQAKE